MFFVTHFVARIGVLTMKRVLHCAALVVVTALPTSVFAQTPDKEAKPLNAATSPFVLSELEGVRMGKARTPGVDDVFERDINQYLIAEISNQRGGAGQAFKSLFELAQRTRDPRVARRAVELAFQTREMKSALDAIVLWLELEPESALARQALGVIASGQGGLEGTKQDVARWLTEPGKAAVLFPQLPSVFARFGDKTKAAAAVAELAKPYPKLAEARYALSLSALSTGNKPDAVASVEEALQLRPAWGQAAILKAQLMREKSEDGAAKYLEEFLRGQPDAREVRLTYARLLASQKSFLSARCWIKPTPTILKFPTQLR
jgi:tetratricopeptide (TPR) repeat protein